MEPGYHYREIICGCCSHRFVYNNTPGDMGIINRYKKRNGTWGIETKCPQCGKVLVAFDDETTAVPFKQREDQEEIEWHTYIAM